MTARAVRAVRAVDRLAAAAPWPRSGRDRCFFNLRPMDGGPGTFSGKLARALDDRGVEVTYRALRGSSAALLFSVAWGDWFHRLCERWGVRRVARVDGIFVPTYFDGREQPAGYQSRKMEPTLAKTNARIARELRCCEFVVYQSAFSKAMCDRFLQERSEDFAIVLNGVDLERFHPGDRRDGRLRLLSMGTIRDEYMLGTVLPVFDRLLREHDCELLVVGPLDATNAGMLEEFRSAHPGAVVRWSGAVPNADLPSLVTEADVLVHPRLGDWCPNVVVEALACGVPVVCGSWGGTAEIVGDGGVVVSTDEWSYGEAFVEGLAAGVRRVIHDLDLFKKAARARAEAELDIRATAERYAAALGFRGQA